MDPSLASQAAVTIDNYILGEEVDIASVDTLASYIYAITKPGEQRDYPDLFLHLISNTLKNAVEKYFEYKFQKESKIKDLAWRLHFIGEQLQHLPSRREESQKKLRAFCVDLSNHLVLYAQAHLQRMS